MHIPAHHRHRVRARRRLRRDQLRHGGRRYRGGGVVPSGQQLGALRRVQHGDLVQRGGGGLFQRGDQAVQRCHQQRAHLLGHRRGHRLGGHREPVPPVIDRHRQRVVRPVGGMQHLDTRRPAAVLVLGLGDGVQVVEQGGEQGRGSGHPAGLLSQRQRGVLMSQQPGQLGPQPGHRRADPVPAHQHPHRQRVNQRPGGPVRTRPGTHPAEQNGAEHHIITPGQHRQHPRPGQVEDHRGRHRGGPGLLADPPGQPGRHLRPGPGGGTAVAAGVQQPVRGGRLGHIGQQGGEVPLVVFARHAQPGPGHVLPERHRGRQLAGVPVPGQQRPDLLQHHVQPGMVQQQVMDLHQAQPAAVTARLGGGADPHQRGPAQVHPLPGRRHQPRRQVVPGGGQGDLSHRQLRLPPHHLHRFGQPLPGHRGPEDVMAGDHRPQRRREVRQPPPPGELQHGGQQVRIPAVICGHAGGGRTCPPAAGPAGRCRPRSPRRHRPRPPPRRSARLPAPPAAACPG